MKVILISGHNNDYQKIEEIVKSNFNKKGEKPTEQPYRTPDVVCLRSDDLLPLAYSGAESSNFYIIREVYSLEFDQAFIEKIKLIEQCSESEKIVFIIHDNQAINKEHHSGSSLYFQITKMLKESNIENFAAYAFYHEANDWIWPAIEKFINKVVIMSSCEANDNISSISSLYNEIINSINGRQRQDRLNEINILRSDLLTPLVALDWIKQMSAPECKIKISDPKTISETKEAAIKAFNESISEKQASDMLQYIFAIKEFEIIRKDVSENDGAITHEDLKNFAFAIESHIEQMQ